MLAQIKSLVPIVAISAAVYGTAKPTFQTATSQADFKKNFTTWMLVCLTAFASPSIWIFMLLAAALISIRTSMNTAPALFLMLVFAVPPLGAEIPGFGLARYLFRITPISLYVMVLLLPMAYGLAKRQDTARFGSTFIDKAVIAYLALDLFLYFGFRSLTDNLRTIVLTCLDVILPYYVFSRVKYDRSELTTTLQNFLVGAAIIGYIGAIESIKSWQLFSAVQESWGIYSALMNYLGREGVLRAQASTGHALILGYSMAIAFGVWLGVRKQYQQAWRGNIILAGILGGLVSSLSRGSWLGAIAALTIHLMLSKGGAKTAVRVLLATLCLCVVLYPTPYGAKIVNFLPFIGEADKGNVDYRTMLAEYSMKIILDSPFFGNPYFIQYLEDLRQGQGIIDIINSYIAIALHSGLIGLTLFLAGFVYAISIMVREAIRRTQQAEPAAMLAATTGAALIMISSVSSIELVPYLYWILLGIGASFVTGVIPARTSLHGIVEKQAN
jgi:hypothetical protein